MRSTSNGRQPECPSASVFARSSSIARTTSRANGCPTPAACEAIRLTCSPASSPGGMNVVARSPKPVVTP